MVDSIKNEYPLNGILCYKVDMLFTSPIIVGNGNSNFTDADIVFDEDRKCPYIPATSIVGVLRSYCKRSDYDHELLNYMFGSEKGASGDMLYQSALQCHDVLLEGFKTIKRDSVKIDPATGTAEPGSKFDYQIAEGLKKSNLYIQINLRHNGFRSEDIASILEFCFSAMNAGVIRFGAKTNKGFGRCDVKVHKVHLDFLDTKEKQKNVKHWLRGDYLPDARYEKNIYDEVVLKEIAPPENQLLIDANFKIKNSLIIRSYPVNSNDADAVMHTTNGFPSIPGASIMGVIRHRARKILFSKFPDKSDNEIDGFLDDLFGWVNPNSEEDAIKGRVCIEETVIPNFLTSVQQRIRIDRFTGAVIRGALFNAEPLWRNDADFNIKITCRYQKDSEIGLLLLVLKDLWTGFLPIGGESSIGRGVLQGKTCTIRVVKEEQINITNSDLSTLATDDLMKLNNYIESIEV